MTYQTKAEGILKIRSLADSLEASENVTVIVAWIGNDSILKSMSFGHQLMLDALAMHVTRVQVQHGASQVVEETSH